MRLGIALGIVSMVAAGCGLAQEPPSDAGPIGNDAATCTSTSTPPYQCVSVVAPHVCGDVEVPPSCVGGAWQCPAGMSHDEVCWCSGQVFHGAGCVCTPSGWSCPDPLDAGPPPCPADPLAAVGTECSYPGQSCGSCTDPCRGQCNTITCSNLRWSPIEVLCPPSFACGTESCQPYTEYCDHVVSDIGGEPDTYRCQPFPQDCPASCACWGTHPGQNCTDDGAGGVTLTFFGG